MVRDGISAIRQKHAGVDPAGFTLIELLVVIAIIALLMAIFLPTLSRVRKQAKAAVCQARIRQWGMVLATYTEDHQGRFPTSLMGYDGLWLLRGAFLGVTEVNDPQDSFYHFHTQGIACCPMATRFVTSNGSFYPNGFGPIGFGGLYNSLQFNGSNQYDAEGLGGSAFTAWVISTNPPSTSTSWEWLNTDPSAFRGSYGFNQWLFKGFHNPVVAGSAALKCGLDVLSLRGRADIPVLLDAAGPCSAPIATTSGGPLGPDGGPDYYMANFVTNRHGEFTNALFLDWSVRRVGLKELWTLPWYAEFNRAGTWTKAGRVKPEAWPKWMRGFKDY